MRALCKSVPAALLSIACISSTTAIGGGHNVEIRETSQDFSKPRLLPRADALPQVPPYRITKGDVGTKDAPVDGLDGKPHAGPFVESATESNRNTLPAEDAPSREKKIPEDGVMNDPNRKPPEKGTTGTEGGVTEKERDRKLQEAEGGERVGNVPSPPKEAPPLPHSEHEESKVGEKTVDQKSTNSEQHTDANSADKPKGGYGLEKPTNLPTVPYSGTGSYGQDDENDSDDEDTEGEHDVLPMDSIIGSFLSILVTEIGDKTFLIAALMAMRHPRLQVYTAAASALLIMTVLSAFTGHAVGSLVSKRFTALVAAGLFLLFGGKSLKEGLAMSPDQGVHEEMEEVRAELEEKEEDMARQAYGRRASSISPYALEAGRASVRRARSSSRLPLRSASSSPSRSPSPHRSSIRSVVAGFKNLLSLLLSPAWVETFAMTFVGELGDRSQIATVAMAAGQEYVWIMAGATLGHLFCTAGAVLGGSALAGRVSMRKVTISGGWIFVIFGLYTFYEALQYWHEP